MLGRTRQQTGSSIAEAAAAMGLLIPLIFAVLYLVAEVSQAYLIKETLAQAAREATRQMAIVYGQGEQIKDDRKLQNKLVFDRIRFSNVIHSSAQFKDPKWDLSGSPPTVSVTVSYTSGQYGLPVFPAPDPLNIGTKFCLEACSVYRLE
jgi:Flp pilus assembly protein TadG